MTPPLLFVNGKQREQERKLPLKLSLESTCDCSLSFVYNAILIPENKNGVTSHGVYIYPLISFSFL